MLDWCQVLELADLHSQPEFVTEEPLAFQVAEGLKEVRACIQTCPSAGKPEMVLRVGTSEIWMVMVAEADSPNLVMRY